MARDKLPVNVDDEFFGAEAWYCIHGEPTCDIKIYGDLDRGDARKLRDWLDAFLGGAPNGK